MPIPCVSQPAVTTLPLKKVIEKQLQAIYAEHGIPIGSSLLGAEQIQDTKTTFDIFIYFFLVMAVLIALIGGLGLMSTMSINVLERTREIGVMRAIGASNGNIQSIVIVEGMVIGLISWIISLALSVPLTTAMTSGVGHAAIWQAVDNGLRLGWYFPLAAWHSGHRHPGQCTARQRSIESDGQRYPGVRVGIVCI